MDDYFFVSVAPLFFMLSVFMQKCGCYVTGERAETSGVVSFVLNIGIHERTVSVQSGPVSCETVEIIYLVCLGMNKNQNRRKAFIQQCEVLEENKSSLCSPPLYTGMFLSNCLSFIEFYGL